MNTSRDARCTKESRAKHDERAAKDGEFSDARNVLNLEIARPTVVAAHIGEHSERARGDDGAADGEAVETVGEIHGIRGTRDNNRDKQKKGQKRERPEMFGMNKRVNNQIRMHAFEERKNELRGIRAVRCENQ